MVRVAQKGKYHHINRVDRDINSTYCWKVQVRRNNQVSERNFSDGVFGGKKKSLQAAIAWRDAILLELDTSRSLENHDHLCRIDRGGKKYCWQVQFQCRERFVRKYFHDETYGGETKAKDAAMAWRDAMLVISRHDRWLRNTTVVKSNNRSGMVGVGRSVSREMVAGKEVERPFWYAAWHDRRIGKQLRRKFFVSKYGERGAKSLAITAREKGIADVIAAEERALNLDDGSSLLHGSRTSLPRPARQGTRAAARTLVRQAI